MVRLKKLDKKALLYRGRNVFLVKNLEILLREASIKCSITVAGVSFKNVIFDDDVELKYLYFVRVKKSELKKAKRLLGAADNNLAEISL